MLDPFVPHLQTVQNKHKAAVFHSLFLFLFFFFFFFFLIGKRAIYYKRQKRQHKVYKEDTSVQQSKEQERKTKNTPSPYMQLNQSTISNMDMDPTSKPPLVHPK